MAAAGWLVRERLPHTARILILFSPLFPSFHAHSPSSPASCPTSAYIELHLHAFNRGLISLGVYTAIQQMFSELLLLKEEQSLNILVFSVKQRVFRFFWTLIKNYWNLWALSCLMCWREGSGQNLNDRSSWRFWARPTSLRVTLIPNHLGQLFTYPKSIAKIKLKDELLWLLGI